MTLRPLQAIALHELATCRGLLGAINVGGGKTIITLLAPAMVGARRPVLFLPASLIEKTRREMSELSMHWQIPRYIEMQSYETLGRENAAEWFDKVQPDMIIGDEIHKVKNNKAAVTRRFIRYMRARPQTFFVGLSGTLYRDDLEDFAHIAAWSLKHNAPVPFDTGELMEWSECLGAKLNPLRQVHPGPLLELVHPPHPDDRDTDVNSAARKVFRRRLADTPGYVASPPGEDVTCSLLVRGMTYKVNAATEANFATLRTTWETPDGWALTMAVDLWRTARQLALGMHYVWSPRPPVPWMDARKAWGKYVREVLSHSRSLDTELQVRHAVEGGHMQGRELLDEWNRRHPTFAINSVPVWHDDSALKLCAKWADTKSGPGIMWTEHSFFARELAKQTGLEYYGEQGLTDGGKSIFDADPKRSLIASIKANATGRNLQAWARGLVTSPPTGHDTWQQLLGRMHRPGQSADTVTFDVLQGCREHWDAMQRAIERSRVTEQLMGESKKLLIADLVLPSPSEVREYARQSARWDKSSGKAEGEDDE
jgi:hypothetical protein